jgi:arylsulfatase A-like enzyme
MGNGDTVNPRRGSHAATPGDERPNIVFVLMDNLGYGEVGCYGGGALRGAPTPRIDGLASEGIRLTNFNVEAQCTPSRAAILTGRFAIRSGTYSVPISGGPEGLTRWEITIAELLAERGYTTAHFGKWHLGSEEGRLPTDQGFDEWYGIPRTSDECLWHGQPEYDPEEVEPEYIMEGRKGQRSRRVEVYDRESRTRIDTEITRRAIDFMARAVAAEKPFYCYVPFTIIHFPTLPHSDFAGSTGYGDFPDCLAEMDHHVGELLNALDTLGVAQKTIFVFTSDNGPDFQAEWLGSPGPWRGAYFTALEGSLRTPFILRWSGKVPAGMVSNEIVHEVDTFTTLIHAAGADTPPDRPIDGVDQMDFFLGQQDRSNREGFPAYVADRLQAVKWRNWKVHFYDPESSTGPEVMAALPTPRAFNLIRDPQERVNLAWTHAWVLRPAMKIVADMAASLAEHPPIPAGTPDA